MLRESLSTLPGAPRPRIRCGQTKLSDVCPASNEDLNAGPALLEALPLLSTRSSRLLSERPLTEPATRNPADTETGQDASRGGSGCQAESGRIGRGGHPTLQPAASDPPRPRWPSPFPVARGLRPRATVRYLLSRHSSKFPSLLPRPAIFGLTLPDRLGRLLTLLRRSARAARGSAASARKTSRRGFPGRGTPAAHRCSSIFTLTRGGVRGGWHRERSQNCVSSS